jgi:putative Ca2+/H+ antiporter (TMEM165/GDT1 family)
MNLSVAALVFGVVFIAELPDKSMFASLALSTRFKKSYVWMGAAAAFLVHVIIAVSAGHLLTLLPKEWLDYIVAGLFLLGAALLLFGKDEDESEERKKLAKQHTHSFAKVFSTAFLVVFLGEWGDITQIATANYAAKYHSPLSVGVGATLGLWAVAGIGVLVGSKVLAKVPGRIVQRITAAILILFAVFGVVSALRA